MSVILNSQSDFAWVHVFPTQVKPLYVVVESTTPPGYDPPVNALVAMRDGDAPPRGVGLEIKAMKSLQAVCTYRAISGEQASLVVCPIYLLDIEDPDDE